MTKLKFVPRWRPGSIKDFKDERAPRTFIPRDDLRTIISRAVQASSSYLTTAERLSLLGVAETAEQVAYGYWIVENIGCPVTQSGVSRCNEGASLFARSFDDLVYEWLREIRESFDEALTPQILVVV